MPARLADDVAIVTGATSGIGRAAAILLAENGAAVVLAGRRRELGEGLVAELRGRDFRAEFVQADVSDADGAGRVVARAAETFGRLTVVVNNAAAFSFASVEETSEDEWDRVLRTNLKSVYLVSKAAIPLLRSSGGGSIINVSSVHAVATMERLAAYATSKAAIVGLTRQMAIDLAIDRIRVNALVVGGVDTAMGRLHLNALGRDPHEADFDASDRRIGRVASPREIAQAVIFLASSDSSFVTGAPLVIDGGTLARQS